jgi:hypothetical protein
VTQVGFFRDKNGKPTGGDYDDKSGAAAQDENRNQHNQTGIENSAQRGGGSEVEL